MPPGGQHFKTRRTRVKDQAGRVVADVGAAERVRGRVQRRRGAAEIPTQREEENVKCKRGLLALSDNEKIGKSLDSQMILILFNPKEVTNYKIQLLKFE